MKDKRPVNLDITTIKFPLAAITSLLHRLSGIFIFLGVALLLYFLDLSLQSESGFALVLELLDSFIVKFLTWAVVAGLLYHLIAGCKHLLMDMGVGETKEAAHTGAVSVVVLALIAFLIAGVWIW